MSEFLTPMGRALADHLWQSTLFLGVMALLALLLRKNQARTRYWLWMAASAKFLIPISLLVALGSHLPLPRHARAATPANTYIAIDQVSQPFADYASFDPPMFDPTAPPAPAQPVWPMAIAAVWSIGVLAMVGFWWVQWRRVAKAVRQSRAMVDGREVEMLARFAVSGSRFEGKAKANTEIPEHSSGMTPPIHLTPNPSTSAASRMTNSIELRVSAEQMEPGVVGILRPVLLWPEGISQHLDDAHLERILAHEVCHVARRDNLTALLPMLVKTIFWFHPLVWWMERQLVKERERACDEEVLLRCGQPGVYAQSILKVCEYCVESPLMCVSGITGADLKRRVVQIMTGGAARRLTWPKKLLLAAVAVAAIAAPIVAGLSSPLRALAADEGWQKAAGGAQRFEVASVRENKTGGDSNSNFTLDGNGNAYWVMDKDTVTAPRGNLFRATNQTLMRYIIFAYRLSGTEELALRMNFWAGAGVKVPEWVNTTHYDIEARTPGPATKDQMRLMMQGLLVERFKLAAHTETRQVPVFAMVMEKTGTLGPGLRAHPASDTCGTTVYPDDAGKGVERSGVTTSAHAASGSGILPMPCGMIARLPASAAGRHRIGGRGVTMAMIAASLPGQTGLATFPRPVIDGTGLGGTFDFTLEWAPPAPIAGGEMAPGPNAKGDEPGPPVAQAMREQLGIKLESTKGPVELLVIDHVERPTAQDADAGTGAAVEAIPTQTVPGSGSATQTVKMGPAVVTETTPAGVVKTYSRYATFTSSSASAMPAAMVQAVNGQRQAAQNSSSSCPDAGGLFAAYDVVSVRPTNATPRFVGLQEQPDGISSETVTVAMMVQQAYSTGGGLPTDDAVAKLPDWAKMPTYFSVQAKLNPKQVSALASLSKDQQKDCRVRMLQALLADRFKLKVHLETRQIPAYDLVVASGGPKMKELMASDPGVFIGSGGKPLVRGNSMRMANGGSEIIVQNFPIEQLVFLLAGPGGVDHRVVDKTGLTGIYSYTLTFAVSHGVGAALTGAQSEPVASDPAPTVFQALEEQLGLRLQRGTATVDTVVVDHIERPSEN